MNDLRKAAEMALEALEALWDILDDIDTASDMAKENDAWYRKRVEALQKKRWDTMITTDGYKLRGGPVEALRQALAHEALDEMVAENQRLGLYDDEPPCKTHPDAPHGFDRNASHAADRYVCECESWKPVDEKAKDRLIRIMGTFDLATGHADTLDQALDALEEELRDVLGHLRARREWVGLTDEEVDEIYMHEGQEDVVLLTQAKLKEKNGFINEA